MTSDSISILSQNASILRISDRKTIQLIELYKEEECLWNTRSNNYKSRDKRSRATERIARKLNIKNFEGHHVVMKFKNLRNSYCQELKKVAASEKLGDDDVYKPKVFWFSNMDSFLRPHLQKVRSTLLKKKHDDPLRIKSEEGNDSDRHISEDSRPSSYLMEDQSLHSEDCGPPAKKRKSKDMEENVRDLEKKVQALTQNKEDYYDSFGKYVASLLRSMPKERAMLLQPQVISLIVSGGLGDPVGQSDEID